jgi:hypothetical protein
VFAKVEPGAYTEEAIEASLHAEDANNAVPDGTNGLFANGHERDGITAPNGAETNGLKVHRMHQHGMTSSTTPFLELHGQPECNYPCNRWLVLIPRCHEVRLGGDRTATTRPPATLRSTRAKRRAVSLGCTHSEGS